jgi:hypothetical protein
MRRTKAGIIYFAVWVETGEPFYVGQTRQTLNERVRQHFKSNKTPMSKLIRVLGREAVLFREIEKASGDALDERERHWIIALNTRHPTGLNQSAGGFSGSLHLARSKAKMSAIMKARCAEPAYHAKIVERNKKLWADPEYRKRQAEGKALVMKNPEYLARMSEVKTKYWNDAEKRVEASDKARAQWADPEQKALKSARISETLSAPEHRERASRLRKEMWADPERRAKQIASMRAGMARKKAERLSRA